MIQIRSPALAIPEAPQAKRPLPISLQVNRRPIQLFSHSLMAGATLIRVPIPHILVYPSPKRMEVKREGNERIQGGSYPSNRSGEALVFIADLLFC